MRQILTLTIFILLACLNLQAQDGSNKFKSRVLSDSTVLKQVPKATIIDGRNNLNKTDNLKQLTKINQTTFYTVDTSFDVTIAKESGLPIFITRKKKDIFNSNLSTKLKNPLRTSTDLTNTCIIFLNEIKYLTHLEADEQSINILSSEKDDLGKTHIRLSQKYKGVKIYGGEFIIHLNSEGLAEIFNGRYKVVNSDISIVPVISGSSAVDNAITDLKAKNKFKELSETEKKLLDYTSPLYETVLYDIDRYDTLMLAYHVTVRPNLLERWEYFIDCNTGKIIKSFESSCTVDGPRTSTGIDLNGVNRIINTYQQGTNYALTDASKFMYNASANSGVIATGDVNFTYGNNFKVQDIISVDNTWNNPKAISAHYNAGVAYDYYKTYHDRNSIDGKGGNIISFINVVNDDGTAYENASWNGKWISYGNGTPTSVKKPWPAALDIAGHEMTHGVVSSSANLEYMAQSGALNESMADIFGCMIDSTNWTIGEAITLNTSGAMRSFSDPHNGGSSVADIFTGWQPRHMNEFVSGAILNNFVDRDNEGVHINSGIPNYAFYLFANSTVGRLKAQKIYYRALTTYLTTKSQFIDLRLAVIQAAKDLYTAADASQAGLAFDAVGITDGISTSKTTILTTNPGTEYLLSYDTDPTNTNGLYRSTPLGTSFAPLLNKAVKSKPSVTDNGKVAVFIGTDSKMYSINVDPSLSLNLTVLQSQAIWANVAVSKDGKRIAAVTASQDTSIYIYDFAKASWGRYMLYSPTFTQGVKSLGPVYADGLEWDYTGTNIIYDCFNKITNTSGNNIQYWDINVMNVWDTVANNFGTGNVAKFFNLSETENIGNPILAKNSPYSMAFDYYNSSTNQYGILGYDIERNSVKAIALNNTVGVPSYNKTDNRLAFASIDVNNNSVINYVTLNSDKISSNGVQSKLVDKAKWPVYYTIGSRAIVLPLTLVNFNVYRNSKDVSLEWETSGELNVDRFEIEKSATSNLWFTIGSKSANGTLSSNNYSFIDNQPLNGLNYYRLKMIDKDGNFTYSSIKSVIFLGNSSRILIAPNPASSQATIFFKTQVAKAEINVYDVQGKLVLTQNATNTNQSILKTDKLSSGTYMVNIIADGQVSNQQLLISK